jgi:hypothetical protein
MNLTTALRSLVVAVGVVSTVLVGVSAAELSAPDDKTPVTAGISISKKHR